MLPLELRLWGGGLTKGVGNHAKVALPTPFDSPPPERQEEGDEEEENRMIENKKEKETERENEK